MTVDRAVAIVGIGCRLPGGVADPRSFWRLLQEGRDAIGEIPPERIDLARWFDPRPATPGRIMSRYGGYLDGIENFDAAFFGISPREAELIDPQQRLLLETAWEALEDAGLDALALRGSRTGVYAGQWISDFEARYAGDAQTLQFRASMGSGRYATSGRVSFALGLRGPSFTIDAACSSSLVAVHLGLRAVRQGECELAIAGGVNVILQPNIHVAYSQGRMMAPDGRCKFGDARGDGYVRSEGAALVVLKPLDAALAAGDRVYAVLRGSATNNDGDVSGSFGRPGVQGQQELLQAAYRDAGVDPATVGYIEAHGTGTRAGDPVEIGALGAVLGPGRAAGARCRVGSIKTNIGHTEGAAGVIGLAKAALALHEGAIPASLHFHEPNPLVPWHDLPFEVPTAAVPWPADGAPRFAGVSSYGIAGSNAHAVLESAPLPPPVERHALPPRPALLVLSARSPEALRALAQQHAQALAGASRERLDAVCWSAATRRAALAQRAAFVADNAASMAAQLAAFAAGEPAALQGEAAEGTALAPVFVLPGQGGQWPGMARELLRGEPAFAAALREADAAARPWTEGSLLDRLAGDDEAALERVERVQPLLTALSIAWGRWLGTLGIEPQALVGHSMGEVGAACLAGVLDLGQAMQVVCRRSARMAAMRGAGAMAVVALPAEALQRRLAGQEAQLSLAAANGPSSSVVAGDAAALAAFVTTLEAEGVFARRIKVDVASHSPQMAGPAAALQADLAGLVPHAAQRPLYSTLLGRRAGPGEAFDATYWARNLREPVQFDACVGALLDGGARCFVELGPHPVLAGAVQETARARGIAVTALACTKRDAPGADSAMALVGALWCAGVQPDWSRVLPRHAAVDLPLYPWQRERHWPRTEATTAAAPARPGAHPLLEQRFDVAGEALVCHETTLSGMRFPWLADHVVRGSVLFPGVAFAEAALAAAREAQPAQPVALADLHFETALPLSAGTAARLQVRSTPGTVELHGRTDATAPWQRHATARLVAAALPPPLPPLPEGGTPLDGDEVYARLARTGLAYGPAFRAVRSLRVDGTRAAGVLQLDDVPAGYVAWPPLLDAALQVLALLSPGGGTPVPVHVAQLVVARPLPAGAPITLQADAATGSVDLLDATGQPLAALRGARFEAVGRSAADPSSWLHDTAWRALALPAAAAVAGPVALVCARPATAAPLAAALAARGVASRVVAPEALGAGLAEPQVVMLGALEAALPDEGLAWIEDAWQHGPDAALAAAQALATAPRPPRVWLATRDAVACGPARRLSIGAAALWGLGRVWAHEQPSLGVTLVDLEGDAGALAELLCAPPPERQIARRGGRWHALALAPWSAAEPAQANAAPSWRAAPATPGTPGSLHWQAATRPAPAPHEVEIEVSHTGLNFMNLLSALGQYPGYEGGLGPLGIECAGRVARTGAAVTHLEAGDAVVAIGHGCLQRHARVRGALVAPLPPGWSAADAAALPIAFLTALHALVDLARLDAGERVLVHSAAGGVGLAAVQIARQRGAEVIASAGTEDKRALLRGMGIAHVVDSRAPFADAVLAATGGRGVDVVLNSLAGDAIAEGLRCLAPYGRFVELGKRDIYGGTRIALAPFRANLSYFAVDLDRMMSERPERLGASLRQLMHDAGAGTWAPLPTTVFEADRVADAFQGLMPGTHVGKHVVALDPPPAQVAPAPGLRAALRLDGCHVVTGGLGALGLEVARWLARRGVPALLLVGRRAPDDAARAAIAELEAQGTRVLTAACDVADRPALAAALDRARREAGPLRGVFHAAGVLADATLDRLTPATLRTPREPKLHGAWNLDRLTEGDDLDAFVLFSSVAALFGTPGQANYAAANAALDALAADRAARGKPALAVAFGPVADVGLAAAEAHRGNALARLGFDGLRAADAIDAIDRLLASGRAHAVCAPFDAERWLAATAHTGATGLVDAAGAPTAAAAGPSLREALEAAPAGAPRRALLEAAVRDEVASVLRLAPQRVPADRALKSLGLDSLMALELRNRLERRSGAALSPTLAWNHPTLAAMAAHLAERLGLALDAAEAPAVEPDLDALLAELEQMSDDEARAQLERGDAA